VPAARLTLVTINTPWTSNSLPSDVGPDSSALFVVTYVDFLVDGDLIKGQDGLVRYGSEPSKAPWQLSDAVLQQLDRPNRFATLEVWDSVGIIPRGRTTKKRPNFSQK
jgi:hypothetical protein